MKIKHINIDLNEVKLDKEMSLILGKQTGGKIKQLSELTPETWHECRTLLIDHVQKMIGSNQVDHVNYEPIRKILFLMHGWEIDNWQKYVGVASTGDGRLIDLWIVPSEVLHKKMTDNLNKKTLLN